MELKGILMLSDSFYPVRGGREMVIDKLMQGLKNNNINAVLGVPKFSKLCKFDDTDLTYNVVRCNAISFTKNEVLSIPNRKFKKQIENEIKSGNINIIHVQTKYGLMKYALKLRKKYDIPVIVSVHTNYPAVYKQTLKIPFVYKFAINRVKKILNKSDCVISVSEFMKNELLKMGAKTNIEVIGNGNNYAGCVVADEDIKNVNKLYGWSDEEKVLVYVGRINKTKSIDVIIEAISKVKTPLKMVFVGGGDIDSYTALAKQLNVSEKCQFLGQINNLDILKTVCARASVQVYPSVAETFGLTIYECGALGVPSIVTQNMATAEQIKDGFNGFITDGSVDEVAKKIDQILAVDFDLKKVSENAKSTMNLSWDKATLKYIEVYKKAIKNTMIK